jgi:hypothetical protein
MDGRFRERRTRLSFDSRIRTRLLVSNKKARESKELSAARRATDRQWEQRFSYDSLDRRETGGEYRGDTSALTYKSKFSYDRFGNRFRKAAENATGSPTTNWVEENQIDPATNRFVNSTTGITYDEAGNVTADPKFRSMQYKYYAVGN